MHDTRKNRSYFWVVSTFLICSFILLANRLDSGSSEESKRFTEIATRTAKDCEVSKNSNGCVDAYVQILKFDSESKYLDGRIFFYPPEKYATQFASSVQVNQITDVYLDAAKLDTGALNQNLYYDKYEFMRGIDFTIDVTNQDWEGCTTDNCYPFDHYSADLTGWVRFILDEGKTDDTSDDKILRLPINVIEYSSVLPNWKLRYDLDYQLKPNFQNVKQIIEWQKSGKFFVVFRIERAPLTILIVTILGLIFLGGALSMLLLLRSVLFSHKRSSLAGLAWAGSTAFTMIQTRTLMPGNPRLGIKFDLIVFYPSLTICFISGLLMLKKWLQDERVNYEI